MATTIQFKRGLDANFGAQSLSAGEPAFVTDTQKLYVGDGTNKVLINPIEQPAGLDTGTEYTKYQVNEYGQVVSQANLVADDIPTIPHTKVSGLGTAATVDTGASEGNVPVLDANGKLLTSTIPAIAITDTFVVASEAAMLALDAQPGDIAVRTDVNKSFILQTAPATVLANWVELLVPADAVTSVNGQTGTVVLDATDIDMTGYSIAGSYTPIATTDSSSVAIGKLEKNFDNYAPLASPALTGTPTAPTPDTADSSTTLATTAYVKTNLSSYAPLASPALTGTPTAPTVASSTDSTTKIATTAFVQSVVATIDGGTF